MPLTQPISTEYTTYGTGFTSLSVGSGNAKPTYLLSRNRDLLQDTDGVSSARMIIVYGIQRYRGQANTSAKKGH